MKEEDYLAFSSMLQNSKAEKFHSLLVFIRRNDLAEKEIATALLISINAYYTLRSRLHSKLQSFLLSNMPGAKEDILQRVSNISTFIHDTPRDTAIAMLSKLEEDLLKYDMPWELTRVYTVLKKLHIDSSKYNDYSNAYDKTVAYTLAIEKLEDLSGSFFKTLSVYFVSGKQEDEKKLFDIREQISGLQKLSNSKHYLLHLHIIDVSIYLFAGDISAQKKSIPAGILLEKIKKILSNYRCNHSFRFLQKTHHFLAFEFFYKKGQLEKVKEHFDEINNTLHSFLLYDFSFTTSRFLLTKASYYKTLGIQHQLYRENQSMTEKYAPGIDNIPNYVEYVKYLAISNYHSGKHIACIKLLNALLQEVSLRNYLYAETEIKMFLAYCYTLVNNNDMASVLIKSAVRKLKDSEQPDEYQNVFAFVKMLSVLIDTSKKAPAEKIKTLKRKFRSLNTSRTKMLEYLNLDEEISFRKAKPAKALDPA